MKFWDQIQELTEMVAEGEIDVEEHVKFIINLYRHLDPNNPEEELSERQMRYIDWLYEGYCNDNWEEFDDYDAA